MKIRTSSDIEVRENEQEVLKDSIPEQKGKKKDKPMFEKMWKKGKLQKPNKVAVLYLRNNGIAEALELESKNGFFNYNGKQYHEREDCTYTVTKDRYPLAIIREDGVIPEGTKVWWHRGIEKKFRELQDQFISAIKYAELVKSGAYKESKLDMKTIIILIIIAVVGGAILINYL